MIIRKMKITFLIDNMCVDSTTTIIRGLNSIRRYNIII